MADGTVLTATALRCDERHGLHVSLGARQGLIPRAEADVSVADGGGRDIAILSRVGQPVAFRITAMPDDGPALLSRVSAQRSAQARLLAAAAPGDVIPAVVTSLAPFGAFCDVGCGFQALLPAARLSVVRPDSCRERLAPGQVIPAVVLRLEADRGRVTLTLRELLGTWEENAARFRPGQTVPGIVRAVAPYGVFIELTPNLAGLAEPTPDLSPGDGAAVYIRSIDPVRRKVKLSVLNRLDGPATPRPPLQFTDTEGHLSQWLYRADQPERRTVFTPPPRG